MLLRNFKRNIFKSGRQFHYHKAKIGRIQEVYQNSKEPTKRHGALKSCGIDFQLLSSPELGTGMYYINRKDPMNNKTLP